MDSLPLKVEVKAKEYWREEWIVIWPVVWARAVVSVVRVGAVGKAVKRSRPVPITIAVTVWTVIMSFIVPAAVAVILSAVVSPALAFIVSAAALVAMSAVMLTTVTAILACEA